jgi:two-component system chemotaxis response regulator CheB
MIRAIIVDDSRVVQVFLSHLLNSDPDIEVVGVANSGMDAIKLVGLVKPDVITMDIHMPGINGYETARKIMATFPTPIVMVSGSASTNDQTITFRSLEAGALAFSKRPPGFGDPQFEAASKKFIKTVKMISEVSNIIS